MKFKLFLILMFMGVAICGCDPRYGFVESDFQLSPDSRLPRWFHISGYDRKDMTMAIFLYTSPLPTPDVEMIVYGPAPLHRKLQVVTGKFHWHPKTKQQGYDKFPQYFIVRVDGLDEVFEQRRRDDILYITDDPKEMATIKK